MANDIADTVMEKPSITGSTMGADGNNEILKSSTENLQTEVFSAGESKANGFHSIAGKLRDSQLQLTDLKITDGSNIIAQTNGPGESNNRNVGGCDPRVRQTVQQKNPNLVRELPVGALEDNVLHEGYGKTLPEQKNPSLQRELPAGALEDNVQHEGNGKTLPQKNPSLQRELPAGALEDNVQYEGYGKTLPEQKNPSLQRELPAGALEDNVQHAGYGKTLPEQKNPSLERELPPGALESIRLSNPIVYSCTGEDSGRGPGGGGGDADSTSIKELPPAPGDGPPPSKQTSNLNFERVVQAGTTLEVQRKSEPDFRQDHLPLHRGADTGTGVTGKAEDGDSRSAGNRLADSKSDDSKSDDSRSDDRRDRLPDDNRERARQADSPSTRLIDKDLDQIADIIRKNGKLPESLKQAFEKGLDSEQMLQLEKLNVLLRGSGRVNDEPIYQVKVGANGDGLKLSLTLKPDSKSDEKTVDSAESKTEAARASGKRIEDLRTTAGGLANIIYNHQDPFRQAENRAKFEEAFRKAKSPQELVNEMNVYLQGSNDRVSLEVAKSGNRTLVVSAQTGSGR